MNNEILMKRFRKQFDEIIEKMSIHEQEWDPSHPLSFNQAGSIIQTMGFLPEETREGRPDYAMFVEFWEMVDAEQRGGIAIVDLFYLLDIIRGSLFPDREIDFDEHSEKINVEAQMAKKGLSKYIYFDYENNMLIGRGGQVKIQRRFEGFKMNKNQKDSMTKAQQVLQSDLSNKLTNKPYVSQKSALLAQKKRQKMAAEGDIVSLLYKQASISKSKQDQKKSDLE